MAGLKPGSRHSVLNIFGPLAEYLLKSLRKFYGRNRHIPSGDFHTKCQTEVGNIGCRSVAIQFHGYRQYSFALFPILPFQL